MKKALRRLLSAALAIALFCEIPVTAFAETPDSMTLIGEDGNTYTYHSDGSVTVKVVPVPSAPAEPDPAGFQRDGENFSGEYNGLEVESAGVYSDGSTLVSVTSDGKIVEFYPETAAAEETEIPEAIEEGPVPEMLQAPLVAAVFAAPAEDVPAEDIPAEAALTEQEPETVAEETEDPDPSEQPEDSAPISQPEESAQEDDEQQESTISEEVPEINTDELTEDSAPEINADESRLPVAQPEAEDTVEIYPSSDGIGQNCSDGLFGSVLYPSAINEYTDVEIVSTENGVKENIILRKLTTSEISYVLSFGGLTPSLSGNTVFLSDKNGQNCGTIRYPGL